ncbi:MAG: hypothetical protein O3A00_29240, partial [Planctomycetota bacterium]|nr:hypothetical protein [Planctomycetota bacterium]
MNSGGYGSAGNFTTATTNSFNSAFEFGSFETHPAFPGGGAAATTASLNTPGPLKLDPDAGNVATSGPANSPSTPPWWKERLWELQNRHIDLWSRIRELDRQIADEQDDFFVDDDAVARWQAERSRLFDQAQIAAREIGEINDSYLGEDHIPQGYADELGDEALEWGYARKFIEAARMALARGEFEGQLKSQMTELLEALKDPAAMA